MYIKWFSRYVSAAILGAFIFGCGGGGGGGGTGGGSATGVVSGIAQAGLIKNGTVRVYRINADGTQTLLKETTTDSNGKYEAVIGNFSGALVVKVFGSYVDEASGKNITVPEAQPLQAALPAGSISTGNLAIAVTPLTDMAVRIAEASGSLSANIASANQSVSQIFGVDIVNTLPALPTVSDLQSSSSTNAQKAYTTVLMALSQYVKNISPTPANPTFTDLQSALIQISSSITSTGSIATISSPQVSLLLQQSAVEITTNSNTASLVTAAGSAAQSCIQRISTIGTIAGGQIKSYKIRTTGSFTGLIYGVQFSIGVPSGVSLRADTTGATDNGIVVTSGQTVSLQTYIAANYSSSNLKVEVANPAGFSSGEVAIFYVDVAAGVALPVASAFTPITGIKAVDGNGSPINGIGVEVF